MKCLTFQGRISFLAKQGRFMRIWLVDLPSSVGRLHCGLVDNVRATCPRTHRLKSLGNRSALLSPGYVPSAELGHSSFLGGAPRIKFDLTVYVRNPRLSELRSLCPLHFQPSDFHDHHIREVCPPCLLVPVLTLLYAADLHACG